jgi:hypothetical protein
MAWVLTFRNVSSSWRTNYLGDRPRFFEEETSEVPEQTPWGGSGSPLYEGLSTDIEISENRGEC